jgi:hypothetical protein
MRKLTLKLDEIRVESLVIAGHPVLEGTVRAHGDTDGACHSHYPCAETYELNCDSEPELSLIYECITLDFPGQGYLTCNPD